MNNNFEKYLGIANHDIQMANTSQELKSYIASVLYENDKKIEEIERLNNIINELENTIANFIKNHTESYIDWKYDREIYLAESNVLQKLFDNYLDKLKELKENKK